MALDKGEKGLRQRLFWGLLVSLPVNLDLWGLASNAVRQRPLTPPAPITVRRILLMPPKVVRKLPPKQIVRQTAQVKPMPRRIPKRKPVVPPHIIPRVLRPPVRPETAAHPLAVHRPFPAKPSLPPPPTHNQLLTAKGPTPAINTVLPGGESPLGKPVERQSSGEERTSTALPLYQDEPSPPVRIEAPTPPAHHDAPAPPARHDEPPVPTGPTQDAQAERQVLPEIPEELKQEDFQSSVRVTVQVDANGGVASVVLRGSSGNAEIDRRVVAALKRWRWKPALQAGKPVASTQHFRFVFEVHE